jgi:uncharacterized protein (DUF488 family)
MKPSEDTIRTVFTVGHGARALEELIALVESAHVETYVDVRRFPGSRRHPQFSSDAMERGLRAAGIGYEWWGEGLGGRRPAKRETPHVAWREAGFRGYADYMDTAAFSEALEALETKALRERVAIACSETLWWRCHRRLIADVLRLHGFTVVHLITAANRQNHPDNPILRVGETGRPVYDVGASTAP